MKLYVIADRYQYRLCQGEPKKSTSGGDIHDVVGHFGTVSDLLKGAFQHLLRSKAKRARDLEKTCGALDAEIDNALSEIELIAQRASDAVMRLTSDIELVAREKAVRSRKNPG